MVGDNIDRNGDGNGTGRSSWVEWEQERGKGEASMGGAGNWERRAKSINW